MPVSTLPTPTQEPEDGRAARRHARTARWAGPLDGRRARLEAWLSLLFVDHGVLRLAYRNRHRVSARMWRSAQPSPADIAWAARHGVRTIVSLRQGQDMGAWPLERDACARHGLDLVVLPLFSRDTPPLDRIRAAETTFAAIRYPALMHCKSGADRAGLGSALYLLFAEGADVATARRALSPRYGHVRHGKTGILDAFLDAYEREGERAGLSLIEWAETLYDPDRVRRDFRPTRLGNLLTERLLRRE
jgi:protein tyrosine phosphatase (PTP) superfamily phosphohydrolase (DUF442 family)